MPAQNSNTTGISVPASMGARLICFFAVATSTVEGVEGTEGEEKAGDGDDGSGRGDVELVSNP